MSSHRNIHTTPNHQWHALLGALMATLVALPATAGIMIPDDPLTTGSRVAPNILFILDDSGSMNFVAMPNEVSDASDSTNYGSGTRKGLRDDPTDRSFLNNTLYYNPNVNYQPWVAADGNRVSGGTSVTSVYSNWNHLTGTRDLRDHVDSVFYMPKAGVTSSTNANDFVRYWVRNNGGTAEVVRTTDPQIVLQTWTWTQTIPEADWVYQTISVPDGTTSLALSIAGNSNNRGNADLYLRRAGNPTTSRYDERGTGSGSNHSFTTPNPQPGTWYVGVRNGDSGSGDRSVTDNVLTITAYTNIVTETPTGRSQAEELANIATWYSYHRSRMKAAKGGASEAFNPLNNNVRVGFRTIHNRNTFNIPVNDGNDGRFSDNPDNPETPNNEATTSRTTWYRRLHAAEGSGGTPLRKALDDAGQYFMGDGTSGPYGPQARANQYACRQNFSILTTDGYWNGNAASVATGNQDNTRGSLITGPNNQSYRYEPAAPYRDSHSGTLADVAMYYWNRDLREDLTNNVPRTEANPAFWQHMVTFGISIGLSGSKGWRSVGEVPSNATWNDPTDREDADRIDDLLHAAVNGRGAFVSAGNPSEFTAGLSEALSAIQQRTSSYSNVATNSVSLDSDTMTFSASYVAGTWSGNVNARRVTRSGVSENVQWVSTIPTWSTRKVFTNNGSLGVSFPTTTQRSALDRSSGGPANFAVSGADNANYLKGESRLEERRGAGNLRNRPATVLGDIVGSSPAYVKQTNTLYVGANDGMLHAFDAATGRELFAYVPNIINFNDLSSLSRGDYNHRWFVDGPIAVTSRSLTDSRNILVGTLGKGGKGLYALDVTDPVNATAESLYKWERTETPGNNMGLVMGRPIFGTVGSNTAAVVIGNGLNSTRERAVLVVMNAQTGAVLREIDTGQGSTAQPNGLSAPVGVYGGDGKTLRYVYAGDMLGNVWKFDLTNASSSAWTATRLFTARDSSGTAQPISAGLTVAVHPRTRKRWVFFGTGRFMTVEDADSSNVRAQSMYGFMEEDATALARADLTRRTVAVTGTSDGYPVRAFEAKADLPADSKGWYVDLPVKGERIVQDAQRVSNILVTASMIPTGDACEADGTGYINALDAFTGTSAGSSYFDLDGDGSTTDQTVGGNPVGSVNYGVGMPTLPNLLRGYTVVSGTGVGGDETSGAGRGLGSGTAAMRWDRVSWREIRSE